MKKAFIGILLLAFFAQCKDKIGPEDCFMAAGKEDEKTIYLNPFTSIDVEDRFIVELVQDSLKAPLMQIEGGENVINNVSVIIDNERLTIKDQNICNWTRDFGKRIKITIYYKELNGLIITDDVSVAAQNTIDSDSLIIEQKGTGTIDMDVFIDGKLEVNHRGFGEIKLSGYAAIFVPTMYDAGKLYAPNLQGDYTFCYHYGINELHVKPFKALFVLVGNTGATYYYKEPIETPPQITRLGSGLVEKK